MTGLNIELDSETLRPLISQVVREALSAIEADRAKLEGKLAYGEAEAARLLSLNTWQLRDLRLRGEIGFSRGPCRKVMYAKKDLSEFLVQRRVEPGRNGKSAD